MNFRLSGGGKSSVIASRYYDYYYVYRITLILYIHLVHAIYIYMKPVIPMYQPWGRRTRVLVEVEVGMSWQHLITLQVYAMILMS